MLSHIFPCLVVLAIATGGTMASSTPTININCQGGTQVCSDGLCEKTWSPVTRSDRSIELIGQPLEFQLQVPNASDNVSQHSEHVQYFTLV